MNKVQENFTRNLKRLREERGLGVRQFASMIGLSHSAILQYENCKRSPTISILKRIAEFFNVSTDYLLENNENDSKK